MEQHELHGNLPGWLCGSGVGRAFAAAQPSTIANQRTRPSMPPSFRSRRRFPTWSGALPSSRRMPLFWSGLPTVAVTNAFLGEAAAAELGAHVFTLKEALKIAVQHSRAYQNSREQLYLTALSLTLSEHQFAPIFSAGGTGTYASADRAGDFLAARSGHGRSRNRC